MSEIDLDTAIFNPASIFKKPEEILHDLKIKLTREQKIRALTNWRYDIQLHRIAEGENMHSEQDEEDVVLEEKILAALQSIENSTPVDGSSHP